MSIPDLFLFSQQSLQDYVDCQRRFQLRFVLRRPWPALPTDPPGAYRHHLQLGADFHRLAHQQALGFDPVRLSETIDDPTLARWWQTFEKHPVPDLPSSVRRAELSVGAPLAGYRLVAKFDLLAAEPARRLVVVDWKTAFKPPLRSTLDRRLQTRVYSYLAVETGAAYNDGHAPVPEQVEMVYWFAAAKGRTERFRYDSDRYLKDRAFLTGLISEIVARELAVWPLTADEQHCRWCGYQSLCERDVGAGPISEMDLEPDLDQLGWDLDLDQIAEIVF